MAKKTGRKRKVNKSQAIREHLAQNPKDGPKATAEALAQKGIKVSPEFVSTVKSTDKRKGGIGGRGRRGRRAAGLGDTMKALESAKNLVDQLGGVAAAKSAIDAYAKLVNQ